MTTSEHPLSSPPLAAHAAVAIDDDDDPSHDKPDSAQSDIRPITYPLASQGVYRSIQGEGVMLGTPMVFIRLAGCSVGCAGCDTNYRVARKGVPAEEIVSQASHVGRNLKWVWITGGEPTDHDLTPLVAALRMAGFRIALATAGIRRVQVGGVAGGFDFVSVSPHDPNRWQQKSGDQINLVPGLNGLRLGDFERHARDMEQRFSACYVTPCAGHPETMDECQAWVARHPAWRLGIQAHLHWGLD